MSPSDFIRLPVVLLEFGEPLKTNIYFLSVTDRAVVLFRKKGETLDMAEYSALTGTGTRLLSRAWEIEKALEEIGTPDETPLELEREPVFWRG